MANIEEIMKNKKEIKPIGNGINDQAVEIKNKMREAELNPVEIKYEHLFVSNQNTYGHNEEDIEKLKSSIIELGYLIDFPLVEKTDDPEHYDILSGQKRYMAITKIKNENEEIFEKIFKNGCIPCKVVDLRTFRTNGSSSECDISIENLRKALIAMANFHHVQTLRDTVLQVEQLSDFYTELKEKRILKNIKATAYIAESGSPVKSRTAQKIINARKNTIPDLWKIIPDLAESVSQLEVISTFPYEEQKEIATRIRNGEKIEFSEYIKLRNAQKNISFENENDDEDYTQPEINITMSDVNVFLNKDIIYELEMRYKDKTFMVSKRDMDDLKKIESQMTKLIKKTEKLIKKAQK